MRKVKERMEKLDVKITFRLTKEEAEHLDELAIKCGCSKSALIRALVRGYQLCEKPDPEFFKLMRELIGIGSRLNQLAAKANALGYIDTPALQEEAKRWREFQLDVRKKYLRPKKLW